MTPKEKAYELYNRFDMIIYTDQDHKPQIYSCMNYFIENMIYENDENEKRISFWENVRDEKNKMEKNNYIY